MQCIDSSVSDESDSKTSHFDKKHFEAKTTILQSSVIPDEICVFFLNFVMASLTPNTYLHISSNDSKQKPLPFLRIFWASP